MASVRELEIECINRVLSELSDKDVHMVLALARAFDREARK